MLKNNFSDYLIAKQGSKVRDGVLTLEVWLPWYRSMPLSVMEVAELVVDGRTLALDGAELELNGKRFALPALPEQVEENWFVQDSAYLHVPASSLSAGPHDVELLVRLYPPYIPMLTWVTRGAVAI